MQIYIAYRITSVLITLPILIEIERDGVFDEMHHDAYATQHHDVTRLK